MPERIRVLIWGKTYPELSAKYTETVCTGGVREDGRPIRLYPVPFRYLNEDGQYKLYDWIEVDVERNFSDPRPESFRVIGGVHRVSHVDSANQWRQRRVAIFAQADEWHFDSVAAVKATQESTGQSLGVVRPGKVEDVRIVPKPPSDRKAYGEKLAEVSAQADMFRPEFKELDYPENDLKIVFRCAGTGCTCADNPHEMKILDWGTLEQARRIGWDKARDHIASVTNPDTHELRFFMGNFRRHLTNFGIVGVWYPKRDVAAERQRTLF